MSTAQAVIGKSAEAPKPANPLTVRNFRLLWIGESISLIGDQFALIAMPWLVLQLTGDALALGVVMALMAVPRALFMLVGGALADRFSPRALIFASNLVRMVLFGILALLVLTNTIQMSLLYVFALAFGVADAFFFPGQNAILPQLLEKDQLQTGNVLIQGMVQLSLFAGPVLAGVLIALLGGAQTGSAAAGSMQGIGAAFGLDALSFLASLVALWMMRIRRPHIADEEQKNIVSAIKEGVAYVWDSSVLRMMFLVILAMNVFIIGPISVGIPVLANTRLSEGSTAFGIIMSAFGGGALGGIILAGVLPHPKPGFFGVLLMIVTVFLGIGLMLLPVSSSTGIVAFITLCMGISSGYVNVSAMTWLQKRIPDELMGRIMSLIMLASVGLEPVSTMLAGFILKTSLEGLFVGAGAALTVVALISATLPAARRMGYEGGSMERAKSIAEALRTTGEMSVIRTTSSSVRLVQ
jgi:MFS family permease